MLIIHLWFVMSLQFYAYARKGHEFVDEVARTLPTTDIDKAGRMTRCVLRALRNKMSVADSFSFLAQLPIALKGVYVDGWKFQEDLNNPISLSDFISEVVKEDDNSAWRDFSNEEEVRNAITAVFRVLSAHLIAGEFLNITKVLSPELRSSLLDRVNVNGHTQ